MHRVPPSARCGVGSTRIHGKAPPCLDSSAPTASAASRTARSSPPSWPCRSPSRRPACSARRGPTRATAPRPSSAATRAPRVSSSPRPSWPAWPSAGVDVYNAGVLPTPAVAYLTADAGADFGVMLSASHNAMPDNGIKFFARGGHKLPDEVEDRIEAAMGEKWARPIGADVGRVVTHDRGPHPLHLAPAAGAAQPARRAQGRHRRRPRCREHGLARGVPARRRRGRRDRHRPRRAQHQRRLRLHPPRPAQGGRGGARRRTSASPTTATPTAAWRSTPPAPRSTATRSWASSPWR